MNTNVMRLIFLLFVFILAVYFSTKNETIGLGETYADAPITTVREEQSPNTTLKPSRLREIFFEINQRYPTSSELELLQFRDIDTDEKAYEIIRGSSTKQENTSQQTVIIAPEVNKVAVAETISSVESEEESADKENYLKYSMIINVFRDTLGRTPTLSELEDHSETIKSLSWSEDKYIASLKETDEYKQLMMKQNESSYSVASTPNWSHHQYVVKKMYKEVYGRDPSSDDLDFLINRFRSYKRNEDKLRKLIQSIHNTEIGVEIKQEPEVSLADIVQQRNLSELKDSYERSNKSKHYEDLVLLPNQEWSVPQKHPPVCTSKKCNIKPMIDQTALIGTLLDDADDTQVGSIMPKFVYKELR